MTDTCIIMFQSLFGSLLNHLYHYANIGVTSILTSIYSLKTVQFMKDLAVFTALNHSGYLGMNFVKFKKINMLFTF